MNLAPISSKGREVIGLRVADSKGVGFLRDADRMHVMYRPLVVSGDRRRGRCAIRIQIAGVQ